jgi:hypothetical protein
MSAMNRLAVEDDCLIITEEECEDNIRVVMYLIKKNGETCFPAKGGVFVLNPQDSLHIDAVRVRVGTLQSKLGKMKVPFKVVLMTGFTNYSVSAVANKKRRNEAIHFALKFLMKLFLTFRQCLLLAFPLLIF